MDQDTDTNGFAATTIDIAGVVLITYAVVKTAFAVRKVVRWAKDVKNAETELNLCTR